MFFELLIIFTIVLISYDTTLFLQSLISQPIFSCQLIGALCGNYEMGLGIGFISQLLFLSYTPVGGAKIPDVQAGPNLIVLLSVDETTSIGFIGQIIPLLIITSIFFLFVTMLERRFATIYMKKIAYEDIRFKRMKRISFSRHFVLFFISSCVSYFLLEANFDRYFSYSIFDGERLFYFTLFFTLGSLCVKYYKRGFKHV